MDLPHLPFFGNLTGKPIELEGPTVIEGTDVTTWPTAFADRDGGLT